MRKEKKIFRGEGEREGKERKYLEMKKDGLRRRKRMQKEKEENIW